MLVKDHMTTKVITIAPSTSVSDALNLVRINKIRRLPVIDREGKLIGIVSEKDLLYASPSPATSLSVYEIGYLLSKLKVEDIMTRTVISVDENLPIEEAALIMAQNKVGALPVVRNGKLVGIITETDIFKVLLDMLAARSEGVRITIEVPDRPGILSSLSAAIAEKNGDIIALGTFSGSDPSHAIVTLKIKGISEADMHAIAESQGYRILDLRTVKAS